MSKIEVSTEYLPAHWASGLVNNDFSGLDDGEAARCIGARERLAADGYSIVSMTEEDPFFTWSYKLYDVCSDAIGGTIAGYVLHRIVD